jgi:hypothetical protein
VDAQRFAKLSSRMTIAGVAFGSCFGHSILAPRMDAVLTAVARPVLDGKGKPTLHRPTVNVIWELVEVEVTNHSARSVTLACFPNSIKDDYKDKEGPVSQEGAPSKVSSPRTAFTVVNGQKSTRFRIYLPYEMMTPSAKAHLTLSYRNNVGPRNKDAWLGDIFARVVANGKG